MATENSPEQIRNATLEEYFQIILRARDKTKPRLTSTEVEELVDRQDELIQTYFENLPKIALSKCPFCHQAFESYFDPWGIDGLWWQNDELTWPFPQIENCKHFVLMQGAVNLNGLPPKGGLSEALTGPEQPFVAPGILSHPAMRLVVSKFEMTNGYWAFPLIYFAAQTPKPGSLMETWRHDTYGWTTDDGRRGWRVCSDPWEFDLRPWINEQKVGWIANALSYENEIPLKDPVFATYDSYPFADVTGRMARLRIIEDGVIEHALPDGNEVNPFL